MFTFIDHMFVSHGLSGELVGVVCHVLCGQSVGVSQYCGTSGVSVPGEGKWDE